MRAGDLMACSPLEDGADLDESQWERSRRFADGARLFHLVRYLCELDGERVALYWHEGGAEQIDSWAAFAIERGVALWSAPWAP